MAYSSEQREKLLQMLAEGKFLSEIEREPGMPDRRTIYRWAHAGDEFAEEIQNAREVGAWVEAEGTVDEIRKCDDPQKARVLLEARKWRLGHITRTFAHKPVVGALVNVDADETFASFARLVEETRTARAGSAHRTITVGGESAPRPADTSGRLASLAGPGGSGMGEDADGG